MSKAMRERPALGCCVPDVALCAGVGLAACGDDDNADKSDRTSARE